MDADKKKFSEEDTCLRYLTPNIEAAGWNKLTAARERAERLVGAVAGNLGTAV